LTLVGSKKTGTIPSIVRKERGGRARGNSERGGCFKAAGKGGRGFTGGANSKKDQKK